MPWHFGWEGHATGGIANALSAIVGDPNTAIHEGKAFTCNLQIPAVANVSRGPAPKSEALREPLKGEGLALQLFYCGSLERFSSALCGNHDPGFPASIFQRDDFLGAFL